MESGRDRPFLSGLSRDDFSALDEISRGLAVTSDLRQRLLDLGLVTRALGAYRITAKGSLLLASGPSM
jgi:hypothetical protein